MRCIRTAFLLLLFDTIDVYVNLLIVETYMTSNQSRLLEVSSPSPKKRFEMRDSYLRADHVPPMSESCTTK